MSKCVVLTLVSFFLAFHAEGQETPDLDEIIDKYVEARGGKQALQSVQSMKMTGLYFYRGLEFPLTIMSMRPNFYRLEIGSDDKKRVALFDGEAAWELTDAGEARAIRDPRTQNFVNSHADLEGALVDYQAKGHKVELAGVDDVDGKEAYRLHVVLSSGRVEDWYIDHTSFLLLKRATTFKRGDDEFRNELFFLDYQTINSLSIPHYIEQNFDPHYVLGYEITTVEINPDLDRELFRVDLDSERNDD